MNAPIIEGCVDSHASALAACRGGADRLELCASLYIGGTTPSRALFKQVQRDCAVRINVLIRPRFGDFLYSEAELEEMREEIEAFRDLGANGVVIGVLTPEGELDEERMRSLMDAARGMEVTLHRAAGRIEIMAGCGVRRENIWAIYDWTGVRAFHTTGRRGPLDSGMVYRKPGVSMGLPSLSEYELWRTDEREFEACARIVHTLNTAH